MGIFLVGIPSCEDNCMRSLDSDVVMSWASLTVLQLLIRDPSSFLLAPRCAVAALRSDVDDSVDTISCRSPKSLI